MHTVAETVLKNSREVKFGRPNLFDLIYLKKSDFENKKNHFLERDHLRMTKKLTTRMSKKMNNHANE